MVFIEVKSLAGVNFIRASDVIAVQFVDRDKCSVILSGGVSLPCVEPASVVADRITVAVGGGNTPVASEKEIAHGDASN
jgi:hypothetical protein